LLHGGLTARNDPAPPIRVVDAGKGHLLSVRGVATCLGVSSATVYKLCAQGALVHVRVSNAIRVAPGDLDQFLAARRRRGS